MKDFFKFLFASCLGSGLAMLLGLFLIFGIFGAMISSLAKTDEDMVVKDNSVLVINFDKPIYDREVNELSNIMVTSSGIDDENIGLMEFIRTINKAKEDKNIKAIMLNLSMFQANGVSTAQEMRAAIEDFKSSGKKVYAYSDMCDEKSYYLGSIADKFMLNPAGSIMLSGMGGEVMYVRALIDKLGIDVDLVRPSSNAFKSAGEMFIRKDMSDSNRMQTSRYLNSIWSVISAQMAKSRQIDINRFNSIVANLEGVGSGDALRNHIVDYLGFKSDFRDTIAKAILTQNHLNKKSKVSFIPYSKYRTTVGDFVAKKDGNIAIVYAYGGVNQGKGSDVSIGSETICKAIYEAANNDKVKAIVLRINSSGGDAIASELITNEVIKAKKKKPVIVSMGDVAASAGYEISSNASYIVANSTTITGSIGVFGVVPNFSRALRQNLGITFDTVKTHANSNPLSVVTPMTPRAKEVMQRNVDDFYTRFIDRVSQGRKKSASYIASVAKGRVWAGVDAKEIGLIDTYGGITKAIEIAAKKANLTSYGIVEYPRVKTIIEQLFNSKEESITSSKLSKSLGKPYYYLLSLKDIVSMQGVQMRMDYIIGF